MNVVRIERANSGHDQLTDDVIALIKGMLVRGDKQSDIAACFLINGGRVAEINHGKRGALIVPAALSDLPPPPPYPSPYELWKTRREAWRARVALEAAELALHEALTAIHKLER